MDKTKTRAAKTTVHARATTATKKARVAKKAAAPNKVIATKPATAAKKAVATTKTAATKKTTAATKTSAAKKATPGKPANAGKRGSNARPASAANRSGGAKAMSSASRSNGSANAANAANRSDRGANAASTTNHGSGTNAANVGDASRLIDAKIADLADWRGETLAQLRAIIRQADPDVVEEWKWGIPVWSHDGILCTGETYKNAVKTTFAHGAALDDPSGLFNSSLDGNTRRAIDFHAGTGIDAKALAALVRAAVALNTAKKASARPARPAKRS